MIPLAVTQRQACADRKSTRAATTTWRHAAVARTLELLGCRGAAAWAYRRALRHHASAAELHLRLGETLAVLERWDEAAHAFRHAARLRPRCEDAYGNLALALHRVGRDQAALEALRALGALHPQRAELHLLLGAWLRRRGHSAEALRAFHHALAAEPVPPTTRFFLGEALLGAEEWGALVAELKHARGVASTATRARPACGHVAPARPRRPSPAPGAWEHTRRAARRVVVHVAQAALALAEGAHRLARGPRRLALLVAGRWHARAGRAPRAIRCFREAQALRGHNLSRAPVPLAVRRAPLRQMARIPGVGPLWLARRRPAPS